MDMEQWTRVHRKVLVEKCSKRFVMDEGGLHWETLQKMLSQSSPPGYRRKKRRGRVELRGGHAGQALEEILEVGIGLDAVQPGELRRRRPSRD